MRNDGSDWSDEDQEDLGGFLEGIDHINGGFRIYIVGRGYTEDWTDLVDELTKKQWNNSPEKEMNLKSWLSSLSDEAMEVIRLIFMMPAEFVTIVCRPKRGYNNTLTMNDLRKVLRKKGWKFKQINKVFAEIRESLKHI